MRSIDYEQIKKYNDLIEVKRKEIKEYNDMKSFLHDRMDTLGNIYEYFALSSCAISVLIVNLFSGPIVYLLPVIAALVAIGLMIGKFVTRKQLDGLNKKIKAAKSIRRQSYDQKELIFEKIFQTYKNKGRDDNGYYNLIVGIEAECKKKTNSMNKLRVERDKLIKIRNFISRWFCYFLAPIAAIGVPLICTFVDVGHIGEISLTISSNIILFICATVDDNLTKKVDEVVEEIDSIKKERTIAYIERDLRINDALDYWRLTSKKYRDMEKKISRKDI